MERSLLLRHLHSNVRIRLFSRIVFLIPFIGCQHAVNDNWQEHLVTVSAYNSVHWQTAGHPNVAAWGDTLVPGERSIAVSRDLIAKGLRHNAEVRIEGLHGIYRVKDKMHDRWKNRIDVYMGKDVKKAREWGRKKLKIWVLVPDKPEEE